MNKMNDKKEILFSITRDDFRIDTFRSGGKGGQHQNKTESGVRITHIESGAVGESREHRSQHQNKEEAMRRLVESKKFKLWHKIKSAQIMLAKSNQKSIEQQVDDEMNPKNIRVDVKDEKGRWVDERK